MRFFERRADDAIRAAAEAFFPENELGAPTGLETGVETRMRSLMDMLPERQRVLVVLLFAFVELVAIFISGRFSRFSRLPPEARVRLANRLRETRIYPLRLVGDSLKGLMGMIYLNHPDVLAYMGMYKTCPRPSDPLRVAFRPAVFGRKKVEPHVEPPRAEP